jgi:hypothetical protein
MTVEPDLIIHGTDQIGEASGELTEWNKTTPAHVTARINLPRALILRPQAITTLPNGRTLKDGLQACERSW